MINSEYEYIALHRDVGETELKQGREIRKGSTLGYVDSAAVRAVKHGRILILEGVERAERGIMPVGTQIPDRLTKLGIKNHNPGVEQLIREPRDVRVWLPPLASRLIWLVTGTLTTERT